MPATITVGSLAVALRLSTTVQVDENDPVIQILNMLLPAAIDRVTDYAPAAPESVSNLAVIRLCGWLYDSDPTDSRVSRALYVSGAQGLLAPYVGRAAGVVSVGAALTPATPATPGTLPPAPAEGDFILSSEEGELKWLKFPIPE